MKDSSLLVSFTAATRNNARSDSIEVVVHSLIPECFP
jgi:hypothetical protein